MYRNMDGTFHIPQYVDLNGKPVERTPWTNPYDFDEYVEWKGNYNEYDSAVYSDRMLSWETAKYDKCSKEVWGDDRRQSFNPERPDLIERFLRLYNNEEKLELTAITRGCNVSNGFPYYVYHYRINH